jgi:hypothetical protein
VQWGTEPSENGDKKQIAVSDVVIKRVCLDVFSNVARSVGIPELVTKPVLILYFCV